MLDSADVDIYAKRLLLEPWVWGLLPALSVRVLFAASTARASATTTSATFAAATFTPTGASKSTADGTTASVGAWL